MSLVSTKIQMVWQHRPNWSAARVVVGSDYANQNNWSRPRRSFKCHPVWSKIKTVGKTGVIPSRRSLAACRPLHFFGAINGALCGSADKWGETHGVGTYPGLHYGDGGPGAAAAE